MPSSSAILCSAPPPRYHPKFLNLPFPSIGCRIDLSALRLILFETPLLTRARAVLLTKVDLPKAAAYTYPQFISALDGTTMRS